MFIVHLPAGYLTTKVLLSHTKLPLSHRRTVVAVGLVGSIFPDLDLIYFYLLDNQKHLHHQY